MDTINSPKIQSWAKEYSGDYTIYYPKNIQDISLIISKNKKMIPSGGFRSYGDSAINNKIINSKFLNKILNFDEKKGILKVQAGIRLKDIINFIMPKGWFLSVTPGTKYATIGGCIASDVHGKEHHKQGCFSESLIKIKLLINEDEIVEFDKKTNPDLFKATCGGMGLTGFIVEAEIKCIKINSSQINYKKVLNNNLEDLFLCFEDYNNYNYSVAWIDTIKKNNNYKSIFTCGNFSDSQDLFSTNKKKFKIHIPLKLKIVNIFTTKLFNNFYFFINKFTKKEGYINYDKFFYPLDNIQNWYKLYGKNGFIQYQLIVPKKNGKEAILKILNYLNKTKNLSSLAVMKLHGKKNDNFLSFPIEGYSLAMDFPYSSKIIKILHNIDDIVLKFGGRVYLTKDSILRDINFKKFYPNFFEINNVIKKYKIFKFCSFQSSRIRIND